MISHRDGYPRSRVLWNSVSLPFRDSTHKVTQMKPVDFPNNRSPQNILFTLVVHALIRDQILNPRHGLLILTYPDNDFLILFSFFGFADVCLTRSTGYKTGGQNIIVADQI